MAWVSPVLPSPTAGPSTWIRRVTSGHAPVAPSAQQDCDAGSTCAVSACTRRGRPEPRDCCALSATGLRRRIHLCRLSLYPASPRFHHPTLGLECLAHHLPRVLHCYRAHAGSRLSFSHEAAQVFEPVAQPDLAGGRPVLVDRIVDWSVPSGRGKKSSDGGASGRSACALPKVAGTAPAVAALTLIPRTAISLSAVSRLPVLPAGTRGAPTTWSTCIHRCSRPLHSYWSRICPKHSECPFA